MANATWGEEEEGNRADYLVPVGPKQESTLLFLVMWVPCGFRTSLTFLPSCHKDVPPCALFWDHFQSFSLPEAGKLNGQGMLE